MSATDRSAVHSTPGRLVAVAPYGARGASTRVRLLDWFAHLGLTAETHFYRDAAANRPREVLSDPVGTGRAELALRRLDVAGTVLVMSREASPFGQGRLESRLLRGAARAVYDFDDALFADVGMARRLLAHPERKCRRATSAATVVIAGNDYLADWASTHARDVRVIPSCVEPDHYRLKTGYRLQAPPRLVWLGSPSTESYVVELVPALLELRRRHGAVLTLISGPADNPALAPLGAMLERVAWSPQRAVEALATADVALGPLRDDAWARGKCAYKLLEYAATGLPMVASPVGANAAAIERFDGLAVTDPAGWVEAVDQLLTEPTARLAQRGATARQGVIEHYSFASWAPAWRAAVLG